MYTRFVIESKLILSYVGGCILLHLYFVYGWKKAFVELFKTIVVRRLSSSYQIKVTYTINSNEVSAWFDFCISISMSVLKGVSHNSNVQYRKELKLFLWRSELVLSYTHNIMYLQCLYHLNHYLFCLFHSNTLLSLLLLWSLLWWWCSRSGLAVVV